MPQSSGSLPRAICRRSAITFSTRGCSLKSTGTFVSLSASALRSAMGTAVSTGSVHFAPRKRSQFTAYGGWKLVRMFLLV